MAVNYSTLLGQGDVIIPWLGASHNKKARTDNIFWTFGNGVEGYGVGYASLCKLSFQLPYTGDQKDKYFLFNPKIV